MKKNGILNMDLCRYIAGLGHKDTFLVGDAGMPIPKGVPIVDLVLCGGVPTFRQVMDAILEETVIESYCIAYEIKEKNPDMLSYIQSKLPNASMEWMTHEELKKRAADCKFAIRTGEFTPYPNIILGAGVAF